jgi:hypothetical protein
MVNLVQRHPFHLVDQSPWPFLAGMSSLSVTTGFVMYMHCYQGGFVLFAFGFFSLLVTFFVMTDPLMLAVLIGAIQNVFSKSSKYTFFDSGCETESVWGTCVDLIPAYLYH